MKNCFGNLYLLLVASEKRESIINEEVAGFLALNLLVFSKTKHVIKQK